MTTRVNHEYVDQATAEVGNFLQQLKDSCKSKSGAAFDSAAAVDWVESTKNQAGVTVPNELNVVLDEAKDDFDRNRIMRAVLDSVAEYETEHGCNMPADVLRLALHNAYSTTADAQKRFALDNVVASGSNAHSDPRSLQSNPAIVAVYTTIAEAIPFAHYMPANIGSNEARLAILTHRTGNAYGAYAQGAILDGIGSGDPYITSARVHTVHPANTSGNITGKLQKLQKNADECDQSSGDVKLLRGRTTVYVDGLIAAREVNTTGTGASQVGGTIEYKGKSYTIGGTINTDTGEFSLTSSPALPETVNVVVEGFIDYERDASIVPQIVSTSDVYQLFAKPWRCNTQISMDAMTQMSSELGLDPFSESVLAINAQFGNERHYDALRKGMRIAVHNSATFDYGAARAHQDSSRAEVWRDLSYALGVISQQMAEDTMNHGVTHLYVGKRVAAQLRALPSTLFTPSGVAERPGIYRIGRLFGLYEVYYTPKVVAETESTAQILCVGRATDVTRNPIVLGDAVAPIVQPLSLGADLKRGAGFYARNFTEINPHAPSARGFGLINVTNM